MKNFLIIFAVVFVTFFSSSIAMGKEQASTSSISNKYCFDIYVDLEGNPILVEIPCPIGSR
ncbi:TPA: hypothetical protein DEP30_03615 [Candidatus Nomurabacteria bacterium]|nr:MAG: hypothetical protein UR97_C0009G0018 [Candidatus Nomurabacteria bacterium GW2011_GWE2_36_115]KKP93395.1 MAG: hypothetical protein US00_C0007G0017 [Candidatus Nomurabacteria bacterium GW2011_GWF2_36_126]KKP96515.1 MAG: hypothetical protein US04_C0001G0017 [Candidatus Nomurabacteria bacterium GW2011_GWD2_36_14]KKP99881.1 MAG: hypothetical protein US08_C0001G0564 [Candidatus Nomurabacteria bacterium GW2011_GWF2_36_19]KKQ04994.1 MAG: hypothetical protein US17_C0009G0017 [Candidatus Nomuraba